MATKKLTRFEKARILGARALQLSMGARPLVKVSKSIDPIDIATLELEKKVLPLSVRKGDK
ncbi:MAG: DNA-directed RNA polymerase subunit K [Methanobrevibacter sp.]|nr:DNA-directed RNA polymerase subunit K [Methanobrevibacter sp.]